MTTTHITQKQSFCFWLAVFICHVQRDYKSEIILADLQIQFALKTNIRSLLCIQDLSMFILYFCIPKPPWECKSRWDFKRVYYYVSNTFFGGLFTEKSKRRNFGKTIHTLTSHSSSLVESTAFETFAEWLSGPVSMCKTKANTNPLHYILLVTVAFSYASTRWLIPLYHNHKKCHVVSQTVVCVCVFHLFCWHCANGLFMNRSKTDPNTGAVNSTKYHQL